MTNSIWQNSSHVCFFVVQFMLVICLPGSLRGDVIFELPDIIAVVPDNSTPFSGSFEVQLILTGADATTPPLVGSYNLSFQSSGSGLTFTSISSTTGVTPLFPIPLDNSSDVTPLTVVANDDYDGDEFSAPLISGLVRVNYTIDAGNVGNTYALVFAPIENPLLANSLASGIDSGSISHGLTLNAGSITVTAVPEAAHLIAAAMGVAICGSTAVSYVRRRRQGMAG